MVTTDRFNCIGELSAQVNQVQLSCNFSYPSEFWPIFWQACAAVATLFAVGVALYQTRQANKTAEKSIKNAEKANDTAEQAIEVARQANLMADSHVNDERYRQASRVIAWMAIDNGMNKPRIFVENASDDAIYNVVVTNKHLANDGEWKIEIMRPRTTIDTALHDDDCTLKQTEIKTVQIGFEDSLGRRYERFPENGGTLSDVGPCWT